MTSSENGARDRLLAAVALLAAALAVLLALVAAIDNSRALVVALLGVFVLVGAGWEAVSRRGTARTVALVVAGGGLVLLVASIGIADVVWWRAIAAAALAVLSVGAARSALHTGVEEVQAAPTPGSPVPAATHPVLLMNPKSGGGKAVRFDLANECRARNIEAVVLGPGDDLLKLAEDAITGGADVIGMAGGDGSQALVATVASRHGIPHVVVPAGTRNHFALDLGLDRDDVVGALDAFSDAVERTIDLATVNGRVFVNNASLGPLREDRPGAGVPRRQDADGGGHAARPARPGRRAARSALRRPRRARPRDGAHGAGVQQPLPARRHVRQGHPGADRPGPARRRRGPHRRASVRPSGSSR